MTRPDGTLYHTVAQIPDHRQSRGRSYSLASLLTFAATAILCGAKSLYAIAQWAATTTTSPRTWMWAGKPLSHSPGPCSPPAP